MFMVYSFLCLLFLKKNVTDYKVYLWRQNDKS